MGEAGDVFVLDADEDILFEEDVIRTPYEVKPWIRYLQHKQNSPQKIRNRLYERALSHIPGSYKLWHAYLVERIRAVKHLPIDHAAFPAVNNVFERALVYMHKMPRIWQEYLRFLTEQHLLTTTRHAFDRALQALPITQHDRIWPLYLKFVNRMNLPELTVRVYRRYLKFDAHDVEDFINLLIKMDRVGEAAQRLSNALNDDTFVSKRGKSKHELWVQLCSLISQHPDHVSGLHVDAIIRQGLQRYSSEAGRLWVALADYYVRGAHFEKARDVYHEAICAVVTVKDFSLVFDAYTQFEESLVSAKMENMDDSDESDNENNDNDYAADLRLFDEDADDVDLRLLRLETLINKRPELLNSVLLRQNPHNVHEWHKRVKLFENDPKLTALTYSEAIKTVNPKKAKGKPHTLWVAFARFYEDHGSFENARKTFEMAVKAPLRHVDDMGAVWCEYAEMELRHKNYNEALKLLQRATAGWRRYEAMNQFDENIPVQQRVHRSLRVWNLYVDLQESLGTVLETRDVYNQMIELKIATPQHIINLATLLEEHKYFEESFRAYEKGISLFSYPHVRDLWVPYLTKFVARYEGKKLERLRDLFEQALDGIPADLAKEMYLMYARIEEQYGLTRHAMAIYERATQAVDASNRFEIFEIYISRAAEFFGVTRTREIYDKAIESVPDHQVKEVCVRYAALERKLGEIDRARAIYVHMAQFCDPRTTQDYWKVWHDFEVAHGNEETFRDMLRIKRNVAAQYSQANITTKVMTGGGMKAESDADYQRRTNPSEPLPSDASLADKMQAMEQQAQQALETSNNNDSGGAINVEIPVRTTTNNTEEIQLDLDDGDGGGGGDDAENSAQKQNGGGIEQRSVPASVFGSAAQLAEELANKDKEKDSNSGGGALARFKR